MTISNAQNAKLFHHGLTTITPLSRLQIRLTTRYISGTRKYQFRSHTRLGRSDSQKSPMNPTWRRLPILVRLPILPGFRPNGSLESVPGGEILTALVTTKVMNMHMTSISYGLLPY